jgi:hypothetical protein
VAKPNQPRTRDGATKQRRSLSHVGGKIELRGDPGPERQVAGEALDVTADETAVRAHVHGFHAYPARLHPLTAARLIEGLTGPGSRVLDPFCGSGTVLVEARLQGRHAWGVDANPLAVELSWLKTGGLVSSQLRQLDAVRQQVVEHAEARRQAKAGPSRRYGQEDRELFDVHVLLELDGLRQGVQAIRQPSLRRALGLVLSATLTKLSRQTSDTSKRPVNRRLAGGFAIRFFSQKAQELGRQLAAFWAQVPPVAPRARVDVGDARRLRTVDKDSIDLVLCSPPYPGVYDYLDHHATRLRWLGLRAGPLARDEIGARRNFRRLEYPTAVRRWELELGDCLREIERVLTRSGTAALLLADTAVGGRAIRADTVIERVGARAQLDVVALAAQPRPHFHAPAARAFARQPRRELLILLRRRGREDAAARRRRRSQRRSP